MFGPQQALCAAMLWATAAAVGGCATVHLWAAYYLGPWSLVKGGMCFAIATVLLKTSEKFGGFDPFPKLRLPRLRLAALVIGAWLLIAFPIAFLWQNPP